MEGSPTKSCWIHFSICLVLVILLLDSSVANNTNSTSLGRLVLKKNFLNDQNIFIEESLFPENDFRCRTIVNLTMKYGFVKNPDYLNSYKVPIVCQWNIVGTEPDEIITISIDELDIDNPNERSKHCAADSLDWKQCCQPNYLKLYSAKNSEKYFCGKSSQMSDGNHSNVFISDTNIVSITFNATTNRKNAAGFYFSYFITSKFSQDCYENEYRCKNGRCIPKKWVCNNQNECGDGSDEVTCNRMMAKPNRWPPLPSPTDLIRCGNDEKSGYYFLKQKCDHRFDCANKADENGCHYCDRHQFRCLSMYNKCINDSLVCDGLPDCPDLSDELDCDHHVHCPPGFLRCGTMARCFDSKQHRCNKILDCPNGADEYNCFERCPGKIMCSSGDGCYDVEERCNGIIQCADYSDEKNCTIELCHMDKGSFLCSNGRCIPSIWTCDRSADCFDGSDEMRCLKNSVITAAIIGSLICGLLIVIAISCGCKLIALRHLEQYRNSIPNVGTIRRNPIGTGISEPFPFPPPGDLDASLFRLEHSVLFREPPPSYASTMGGYHDVNGANNSYMDQYRRYRRQRRCRRILRRQHRNSNGGPQQQQQQQQQNQSTNNSSNHGLINLTINNHNESPIDSLDSSMVTDHNHNHHHHHRRHHHHHHHHHSNNRVTSSIETTEIINGNGNETGSNSIVAASYLRNDQDKKLENNGPMIMTGGNSSASGGGGGDDDDDAVVIISPTAQTTTTTTNNHLNIELEPIPPLNNFDCDSQPLIR